jgi:hypothetical protein
MISIYFIPIPVGTPRAQAHHKNERLNETREPQLVGDARNGNRDAIAELFRRHYTHSIVCGAAIGDWFSAPDLDRIYREIKPIDFSKDVLSAAPERLLVLCDGPSGWTDFGNPQRAMDVLHALSVLSRV